MTENYVHQLPFLRKLLMSVTLAAGIALPASAYDVTANVVDSVGEPEAFPTFKIVNVADTTSTILGVADENGRLNQTIETAGDYVIYVSAVGKQTARRDFEVGPESPVADLGDIVMLTFGKELGEVTVTALRPLVSREIDRVSYDIQADEDSKTSQFNEILNKVPMVSVDPDGTIRVMGSTSFKIYKNGRPSKSLSNNAKELFKSIPASMIKRVEVITDPGAREDAEGSSAILNIVMMENTFTAGAIGNVGLHYTTTNNFPMPNAFVSAQLDKVSLSAYGGAYSQPARSNRSRGKAHAVYDESGDIMERTQSSENDNNGAWFGFEASWELDTLNLFTAEFSGYFGKTKSDYIWDISMFDKTGKPLYSYTQKQHNDPVRYRDFNGSVNYQRSTRLKGESITLSYLVSTTNQLTNDSTWLENVVNSPVAYTGYHNSFNLNFIEHTAQIDWARPFGRIHKLDIGGKFIARRNHSVNDQNYTGVGRDTIDYSHNTYIGAIYADYRAQVGRWGFRAGLRYELSRLNSDYVDEENPAYHTTLSDLCPSAAVSFNINDASSIKVSYSTSISRPGISYLNPAVKRAPLSETHGNPNLNSARNNSFMLNYTYFSRKISLNIDAGYSFINNGIIENRTIDSENITHTTYANNGRTATATLSAWVQWKVGSKTSLSLNGFGQYADYRNDNLGLKNSGFGGRASIYLSQQLPWKLRFTASTGIFYYPVSGLYNESKFRWSSAMYYNLGLSRAFLKEDRLQVYINTSSPVWKSWKHSYGYTVNVPVTWVNEWWTKNNLMISMGVSYRFGSMNIRVKKTAAKITNNDLIGRKN